MRAVLVKPVNKGGLLQRIYEAGISERASLAYTAPAQAMLREQQNSFNGQATGGVGDDTYHHTWAEGQALTLEQAIAYALHGEQSVKN